MKRKVLSIILSLMLCVGLTVPNLAANDKTVTDPLGNITVTNVLKESTIALNEYTVIPVYWVPDTGANITFHNAEEAIKKDDHVVTNFWEEMDEGMLIKMGGGFTVENLLRSDGTYGMDIKLSNRLKGYVEMYNEKHFNEIMYLDSRIALVFVKSDSSTPALTATPTASTVLVNGKQVAFDAYNINGNNYFKLRDLAYVLSGTQKQFDVGWDGAKNAISLTSGKAYTVAGGEMTGKGAGNKTPTPTSSKIYLDGKEVTFTAYNIDGNNYFKHQRYKLR